MCLLIDSPVGPLLAEYDEAGVAALRFWPPGEPPPGGTHLEPAEEDTLGRQLVRELREYFAGERVGFSVALKLRGTEFQRGVWEALRRIPFGETRSYGDLARELGRPGAARAVGQANARNPVPIVVPCHRVVAADGGLGGYLGVWGEHTATSTKQWLLRHERGEAAE